MKLIGYSINTLTLFGIVLATGIVVDDAIVVIENIERHMREFGKSAHDAAVDAMREVFSAVVVIGIVLVAVFLPVAFFPGTTGRMYQQFSMTITFAVILSVFNAVTFTPALAALLLDKAEPRARQVFHRREPRDRRRNEWIRARRRRCPAVEVGDGASCSSCRSARRGGCIRPFLARSCRPRTRATSSPSCRRRRARRSSTRRTS